LLAMRRAAGGEEGEITAQHPGLGRGSQVDASCSRAWRTGASGVPRLAA
jgi:hypothetical protein